MRRCQKLDTAWNNAHEINGLQCKQNGHCYCRLAAPSHDSVEAGPGRWHHVYTDHRRDEKPIPRHSLALASNCCTYHHRRPEYAWQSSRYSGGRRCNRRPILAQLLFNQVASRSLYAISIDNALLCVVLAYASGRGQSPIGPYGFPRRLHGVPGCAGILPSRATPCTSGESASEKTTTRWWAKVTRFTVSCPGPRIWSMHRV